MTDLTITLLLTVLFFAIVVVLAIADTKYMKQRMRKKKDD